MTFLFTDIEGSTRLLYTMGDRYAVALDEHRRCLREAFAGHQGVEVDTQGDGFFYVFAGAGSAVAAADDGQRALAGGPLRVRMGVHTGEALLTREGYVGIDVHRAARIAACGHGGQVVLSEQTRQQLSEAFTVCNLGRHRLKDLEQPEQLYQLGTGDFPPLKSLNQASLPAQATPFIGRERELSDVLALMRRVDVRLLTLLGPGGSGKTRLALRAAAELVDAYADGVWFVNLASLRDPRFVVAAIARSLGLRGVGGDTRNQRLLDHLRDKRLLLVIDNIEQLLPAAAQRLSKLLVATSHAQMLVTSREPLRLTTEHQYAVAPLGQEEAVALFTDRARAVRADFELGSHNRQTIADLCARLDGLPLAIELAAAWMRILTPASLLTRLAQRLPVLEGGAHDAPARQRTLRATIAWSCERLTGDERSVFERLSVFSGGCTLNAAEAVCGARVNTLAGLADKNLIRFEATPDSEPRYLMLETVREFAGETLHAAGGAETFEQLHAAYFLDLAESMRPPRDVPQPSWFRWVAAELDNLQTAFECLVRYDPCAALRLTLLLKRHWALTEGGEGRIWLARALASTAERDELRADALWTLSLWSTFNGAFNEARSLAVEALQVATELGSERYRGNALHAMAIATNHQAPAGWSDDGLDHYREAEPLVRRAGEPWEVALLLNNYGYQLYLAGDLEAGLFKLREGVALARRLDDAWLYSTFHGSLAEVELAAGNRAEAESNWRHELAAARDIGSMLRASEGLGGLARLALDAGQAARCMLLLGAATELHRKAGSLPIGPAVVFVETDEAKARQLIGHAAAEAAWAEGVGMSLEEAVQFGLAGQRRTAV